MGTLHISDRKDLQAALETLRAGDCVEVESFAAVAANAKGLLAAAVKIAEHGADFVSLCEGIDTRNDPNGVFFSLCRALNALDRASDREKQLDGIERAKEDGKYRGRKPIEVDGELFESVAALWQDGQISAREAMARLELKPNTFYRRIKEREEQKMKGIRQTERALRAEVKAAEKKSKKELDDLKKQVRAEARSVKKAAEPAPELHHVEKEIRKGRERAEAEHLDNYKQLKKDVEAETKALKKLLKEG